MNRLSPARSRGFVVHGVSANKRFLFILIGLFLLLAPASVSGASADSDLNLKWIRVGVLFLMMFVGLRWFRLPSFGELAGKTLLLACVFTVASLWSTSPLWALLYKGMFVCAVCASVSLANCLRTEADFRVLTRTLTFSALIGALAVGYLVYVQQDYIMWHGRLVLAQINANTTGLSAAIFALLCLFHLLIGDRLMWKVLAILLIGVMAVLVVLSGSRAAVLTIVAGGLLLMPAMAGSRRNAVGLTIVSLLSLATVSAVWFLSYGDLEVASFEAEDQFDQSEDQLRLLDSMTKDTRLKIWTHVVTRWLEDNPFLGAGWLNEGSRWRLVQSSYLQIAAESGVPGVFCVFIFVFGGATTLYRAMHYARLQKGFGSLLMYLFAATFFAVAFHGIFESAMVVGSSPNAILLGFSAAQLDVQLRTIEIKRRQAALARRQGLASGAVPAAAAQVSGHSGSVRRPPPGAAPSPARRRR